MIRYSTVFVLLFTLTGNIIKETLATSVVGRGSGGNVTEAPPTPKIGDTGDRQQTKDDLKDINTMPPMQRPPLDVKVEIDLESVEDIGVLLKLEFYLQVEWYDSREENTTLFLTGHGTGLYTWMPDLYFILGQNIRYSPATQYLSIENGRMKYNHKISLSVPCLPDAANFPFDELPCTLRLASYGYTENKMMLRWGSEGAMFSHPFDRLEHYGFSWSKYGIVPSIEHVQYSSGIYSVLICTFQFSRLYSVYIMQYIIPASILVVISWSSFWLNVEATPGRACIGVTTILTMMTLTKSLSHDSTSSYLSLSTSMLDVYLWVSFMYIIAAFLEFAISDNFKAKDKTVKLPSNYRDITAKRMNIISRYVFSSTFCAFNLVYWSYAFAILLKRDDD